MTELSVVTTVWFAALSCTTVGVLGLNIDFGKRHKLDPVSIRNLVADEVSKEGEEERWSGRT